MFYWLLFGLSGIVETAAFWEPAMPSTRRSSNSQANFTR